jgi:hypothetical protein
VRTAAGILGIREDDAVQRHGESASVASCSLHQVRDNIHSWDPVNAFWHFVQDPRADAVYNIGGGRQDWLMRDLRPARCSAVIYTTGHGQTDGMTALFVEDATFLPKPYTVKRLTEAVLATAEERPR